MAHLAEPEDPRGGAPGPPGHPLLHTCTIITVGANELMAPIHDRMPAMLLPGDEALWLDPRAAVDRVLPVLRPYPSELLEAFPVSPRVNRPGANSLELLQRVEVPPPAVDPAPTPNSL